MTEDYDKTVETSELVQEELEDILLQIGKLIECSSPYSVDRLVEQLKRIGKISAETALHIRAICEGKD